MPTAIAERQDFLESLTESRAKGSLMDGQDDGS